MLFVESRGAMVDLVWIWLALVGLILAIIWTSKRSSVGLPLGYVLNLSLIHFSGALPYCKPGYRPMAQSLLDNFYGFHTTFLGFNVAVIGLVGYAIGTLAAGFTSSGPLPTRPGVLTVFCMKLPATLLLLSLVFFFVLFPVMRLVPSMGSLGARGVSLSMVAACLACWNAWLLQDRRKLVLWLFGASLGFPTITLFFLGFTSFGVAAATVVWVFVLAFYKPRWLCVIVLVLLVYSGYTMFVNYLRERNSIREAVWGQQDSASRLDRMANMFRRFELFSWSNNYHLEAIDARLNQNHLVGLSIEYIESGRQQFANGSTLYLASVAWVPRILWPNKPSTAGSGGVVSMYTGLKFAAGTSVGVGHVMELYVNYGTKCVFVGLLIVGFVVRLADIKAAHHLISGNYPGFAKWIIPSMGLLDVTSNFATAVASMAAGIVFTWILDKTVFARALAISDWQTRGRFPSRRPLPSASDGTQP